MTNEEIIAIARECYLTLQDDGIYVESLITFARRIAAIEKQRYDFQLEMLGLSTVDALQSQVDEMREVNNRLHDELQGKK